MAFSFDSYMLKEANDPTRQANQRARTDADGPPLLAVDKRLVIPAGQGREIHRHRRRRDPQLRGPGLLDQAGRQPGPAPRDLGQGRSPGRLFRPMLGAVRRAPRLHADRGRGGFAARSSRSGSRQKAATCRARSPALRQPLQPSGQRRATAQPPRRGGRGTGDVHANPRRPRRPTRTSPTARTKLSRRTCSP